MNQVKRIPVDSKKISFDSKEAGCHLFQLKNGWGCVVTAIEYDYYIVMFVYFEDNGTDIKYVFTDNNNVDRYKVSKKETAEYMMDKFEIHIPEFEFFIESVNACATDYSIAIADNRFISNDISAFQ